MTETRQFDFQLNRRNVGHIQRLKKTADLKKAEKTHNFELTLGYGEFDALLYVKTCLVIENFMHSILILFCFRLLLDLRLFT